MLHRRIEDVMKHRDVVHAPPPATVQQAARLMAAKHVAAMIVSDENDHLAGIFTERDLVCRVIAPGLDPKATRLGDVMTPHPAAIAPTATVRDALILMDGCNVRHLPVVQNDHVVGIVSMRDFVSQEIAEIEFQHEKEGDLAETIW